VTRKTFLRITGISALAVAGQKLRGVFAASPAAPAPVRWAMVIDAQKCLKEKNGCTDCLAACHKAHNVPDIPNRAHEVKWIWKEPFKQAFPSQENPYTEETFRGKPFMVLCNHCDNPPCVRVCPTKATWKREDGIVMMDWHRCIGCRYCVAACPYGSRSFYWMDPRPSIPVLNPDYPTRTKGVVEKCTFCEERLAKGRPPACVEICPQKALIFGDLSDRSSALRQLLGAHYSIRRKPELGTRPSIFYIV
jgi:Fe-S-cluster-containing dehydrogenase component